MIEVKIDYDRFCRHELNNVPYVNEKIEELRRRTVRATLSEVREYLKANIFGIQIDDGIRQPQDGMPHFRWLTLLVRGDFKITFFSGLKDGVIEDSDFSGNEDHLFEDSIEKWISKNLPLTACMMTYDHMRETSRKDVNDDIVQEFFNPRLPEPDQKALNWEADRYVIMTEKRHNTEDGIFPAGSQLVARGNSLQECIDHVHKLHGDGVLSAYKDHVVEIPGKHGLQVGENHPFTLMYQTTDSGGNRVQHLFHVVDIERLPRLT